MKEAIVPNNAVAIFGPDTKTPGTAIKIMGEVNKRF